MLQCSDCQGKLRRVHRTVAEKILYAAMFECRQCNARTPEPRWYALYKGDYPRCPRCATFRLTRLATRDKIDPMQKGFVNFALKLVGSELYHCRYCRLQFYDTRKPIAPEGGEKADAVAPIATAVQGSEGA